jgi:hypothetical protein
VKRPNKDAFQRFSARILSERTTHTTIHIVGNHARICPIKIKHSLLLLKSQRCVGIRQQEQHVRGTLIVAQWISNRFMQLIFVYKRQEKLEHK